jgi:ethanolamine utilization protein EutA (predicted chaperonin)
MIGASLCLLSNIAGADAGVLVQVAEKPTKSVVYIAEPIKNVGRWLDRGDAMESTWDGGYIKVNFSGSTIRVNLLDEGNITARIDASPEVVFKNVSGPVKLTPVALPAGNHTLRLYVTKGGVKIAVIAVAEQAAVNAAPVLPQLIEFVGDSITADVGAANYSALASDTSGAEHVRLAVSAIVWQQAPCF